MSKFKAFAGVGHGGRDSGAVGNGLRESNINLVQALAWEKEMKRHGVEVKLSRYKDENDNINEEVRECNTFNPDIAVDFHTNSGGGDGCEFLHSVFGSDSKRLAGCINDEVLKLGQNSRGLKIKKRNDGRDYYAFIRSTICPAVISECAFIDNKNDISIVDTKAEQEAYGIAVAKGCLKYLGITYKPQINGGTSTIHKYANGDYNRKARIVGTEDGFLNVRIARKDFRDEAIIGTFKEGQIITVNYCKDNWFSTWDCKGEEGYVSGVYIELL